MDEKEAVSHELEALRKRNSELEALNLECRLAEEGMRLSHRFLEIANHHTGRRSLFREIVAEVRRFSRCSGVGIRLLDDDGNIPYEAYTGFSKKFYEKESPLSIKSDRCMCINVVKGETDSSLPFFTRGGSFYMNGTTRFLADVSEEDKGETRNACNQVGFESVTLIPIRQPDRIIGLIHMADYREDMVPLKMVEMLEEAAQQLGQAVKRILVEEVLRKAELDYRTVADFTNDWEYWENPDGTMRYVSPACEPITGYSPDHFIRTPEFREKIILPEDREIWKKHCKPGAEDSALRGIQFRIRRKDGEIRWLEHACRSVTDEQGNFLGYRAGNRDITERVQAREKLETALREKELLVKEAHHRVKNNFAIISSLLAIQSNAVTDPEGLEVLKKSHAHIMLMSRLHEALYQSANITDVDMKGYLARVIEDLCESYNIDACMIQVKMDIDAILLGSKVATSCGLIVTELFTNAFKHAFPGGEGGDIFVKLAFSNGSFSLVVADNGAGLPEGVDLRNMSSVGLELVEMLTRQLGGECVIDRNAGTTFKITFPPEN